MESAVHSRVEHGGYGVARITVQKADGRVLHYYSLPWIPIWDFKGRLRVRAIMRSHLQEFGEHHVETPNHPIPARRKRRRRA